MMELKEDYFEDGPASFWPIVSSGQRQQRARIAKAFKRAKNSVLLVDDEPVQLALYGALLRKAGYRVFEANSGREALRILGNTFVDVVLCDMVMPGTNGIDVLHELRSLRTFPTSAHVPVILFTAAENPPQSDDAREADALVSKRDPPQSLINRIDFLAQHEQVAV